MNQHTKEYKIDMLFHKVLTMMVGLRLLADFQAAELYGDRKIL